MAAHAPAATRASECTVAMQSNLQCPLQKFLRVQVIAYLGQQVSSANWVPADNLPVACFTCSVLSAAILHYTSGQKC